MTKEKSRRDFLKETVRILAAIPLAGWMENFAISAQSKKSFFEQTEVNTAGNDGYNTYRIPSLIMTKKNTLLAFCEGRRGGASDTGDIDLLLKRSRDGGKPGRISKSSGMRARIPASIRVRSLIIKPAEFIC